MDVSYFWNKVLIKLSEMDRSIEWMCKQTGLSVRTTKNRINKGIMPRLNEAVLILNVFGTTLENFCGISAYDYAREEEKTLTVPIYDQLFSAGHGQFMAEEEEVSGHVAVPDSLKRYKEHLAATYVRGDSMEPTLYNGDTIICDNLGYDGRSGVYVIQYQGMGFVKRLQKKDGVVAIISDNPSYKTMYESLESEDFRVIGKVRYVMHDI